jgi:hypothetical protein
LKTGEGGRAEGKSYGEKAWSSIIYSL